MTAKEAVNWIINIMADIGKSEHRALWHYEQALMEIREMLETSAQPEKRTNERTETHACDLISRQAAIDALHMHLMYRMGTDSNKKRLDDWINGLPSAQPATNCSEIPNGSDDTISRQAAIDAVWW